MSDRHTKFARVPSHVIRYRNFNGDEAFISLYEQDEPEPKSDSDLANMAHTILGANVVDILRVSGSFRSYRADERDHE